MKDVFGEQRAPIMKTTFVNFDAIVSFSLAPKWFAHFFAHL